MYIGNLTKSQLIALINEQLQEYQKETLKVGKQMTVLMDLLQNQNKELLTIKDIVKLFSISLASVHNWVKEGKLIKHKVGGRSLFKKEEVDKLINLSKK